MRQQTVAIREDLHDYAVVGRQEGVLADVLLARHPLLDHPRSHRVVVALAVEDADELREVTVVRRRLRLLRSAQHRLAMVGRVPVADCVGI